MPPVRIFRRKKGKGYRNFKKRVAREAVQLAETKQRSLALSSYLDMIPAQFYLNGDEFAGQSSPSWDPAKVQSTSQIVAAAAEAELAQAVVAAKERAKNAPVSALPADEKLVVEKSKLRVVQASLF